MQTTTASMHCCRALAPAWSQVRPTTARPAKPTAAREAMTMAIKTTTVMTRRKGGARRLAAAMVANPPTNHSASLPSVDSSSNSNSNSNDSAWESFLSKEDLSEMLPEWVAEGLVFALEFCIEPEGQSPSSITQSSLRLWRTAIDFVGITDCDQIIHAISRCRGDHPKAVIRLVGHHPFNSRYKHIFGLVG